MTSGERPETLETSSRQRRHSYRMQWAQVILLQQCLDELREFNGIQHSNYYTCTNINITSTEHDFVMSKPRPEDAP